MNEMPVVAIVGRPNVGKSSLLNALIGKRISIVQDQPGVTRDRVSMPFDIDGRFIELVDTGGYGFVDPDQLTEHIRRQIELAMQRADLVLLLVDAKAGLTSADEQIASLLRRKNIKTVVVANKSDGPKQDLALGEFARLGFGTPIGVSALNDRNIDDLVEIIRKNVDLSKAPEILNKPQMLLAIVGKRNAGKSTLVNSIGKLYGLEEERVIVSDVPGTTRDSIDVRFEKNGQAIIVIDTAGVRKKRHMVTNDVAFYSFHRAQRSIRRADVALMLLDGTEHISEPDKKLAQYIAEQYKPVVIVVNKWDVLVKQAQEQAEERDMGFDEQLLMKEFSEYVNQELRHVDFAPIACISAKTGEDVPQVLELAQHLFKQANTRVGTGELNRIVHQIMQERTPSTPSGRRIKVLYVTQTDISPPTIVLFVNHAKDVSESYQRFMINRLRELLPYAEVPIRLVIRGRTGAPDAEISKDAKPSARARSGKSSAKMRSGSRKISARRQRK